MKKTSHLFVVLCVLAFTTFTFEGCTEKHLDALVSWSQVASGSEDPLSSEPGAITVNGYMKQIFSSLGYETSSGDYIILRDQSSSGDANDKALVIAKKVEETLFSTYPNLKSELQSSITKLEYQIICDCDDAKTVVYTIKIR